MRTIPARRHRDQVRCYVCNSWVLADDVEFLSRRKGREGEPVVRFTCLCGRMSESAVFGRSAPPDRVKENAL